MAGNPLPECEASRQERETVGNFIRLRAMRRAHFYLLALLASLVGAACSPDEVPRATLAAPVEVPLAPYIGRLLTLDVLIDGDTARLILDTGGGETVVSPAIAQRLGCTPSGRSIGYRMNGDPIAIASCPAVTLIVGGIPFVHDRIGIWDVQALLPEGVPPVDGVFSLKTLVRQPFTLRLAERRLTLETSRSFREQVLGMSRLRSRLATGTDGDELTVFVRGVVGDTVWFLIDSGNLDVVQAGPHLRGRTESDAGDTWEAELTLDGLPGVGTTFRTRDIIYDGVLSEEFLRQWILAFDLASNEVWAAPIR